MNLIGGTAGRRFLSTQDEVEFRVDRGEAFLVAHQSLVPAGGQVEYLIRVGANAMHTTFSVTAGIDVLGSVYENVTFANAGSGITPRNRSRETGDTSLGSVSLNPTMTSSGTMLSDVYLPGGEKHSAIGATMKSGAEWILAPGRSYLLSVYNRLVSQPAATRCGVSIDFYEPEGLNSP